MSVIENNRACCGCGACESICKNNAIKLVENNETFLYPLVNKDLCINCGLCEKTCPLLFDSFITTENVVSYIGVHMSNDVIFNSSSGGAFSALCELYISKGYKVYGVQYDENLKVVYGSALSIEECKKFRKSKYVQSYYNDCYEKIAFDLNTGYQVLFSGVSCQCAALLSYLGVKKISCSNLVVVNILCHGVPSQKMFDSYLKELENNEKSHVTKYMFRNKYAEHGKVNSRTSWIEFDNGKKSISNQIDDAFLRGYYKRLFYRPSCEICKFARRERLSDFTIADAWNVESLFSEYDTLSGVSLILFNTDKAKQVLEEISAKMKIKKVSLEWTFSSQELFRAPTVMNENREKFFKYWLEKDFSTAVYKCTRLPLKHRLIRLFPSVLRHKLKLIIKR